MTPRTYIGKTFKVIRADQLRLGDYMLYHNISDGMYHTTMVVSLELHGDDVVINGNGWSSSGEINTSEGNAVLVQEEEIP